MHHRSLIARTRSFCTGSGQHLTPETLKTFNWEQVKTAPTQTTFRTKRRAKQKNPQPRNECENSPLTLQDGPRSPSLPSLVFLSSPLLPLFSSSSLFSYLEVGRLFLRSVLLILSSFLFYFFRLGAEVGALSSSFPPVFCPICFAVCLKWWVGKDG
jgi:hypothetical protein